MSDIHIPDKSLRIALEYTVGKPLTEDKLLTVTYFEWNALVINEGETFHPIRNIEGLQYCKNLHFLSLDGNKVVDLTPLKNLTKLREIWLVANSVEDVTPISKLPDLETLVLDTNSNLSDISPLKDLPSINYITLQYTKVKDITPIKNLKTLNVININEIDASPGSENRKVLIELIKRGVKVYIQGIGEIANETKLI